MSHRLTTALLVTTLIAAACGGSDDDASSTTTNIAAVASTAAGDGSSTTLPASSVTTDPSTTTTVDPRPLSPLNGLPVDDPTLIDRKMIAVKIDNSTNAQPQSGIESADAIVELVVEAGWTRFIALFLESDTEWLGPMRSVRPTDSTIVAPLNGVIQMSGGQPWVQARVLADDVAMIGEVGAPVTMRWNGRNRPHNLYVNTVEIRNLVDERGLDPAPPPALFEWGTLSDSAEIAIGDILFDWTNRVDITWRWTGTEYLRFVGDEPHTWRTEDGEVEEHLAADTLVVLKTDQYVACPSGAGSCVPASETVGENGALVFAGGRVVEGQWHRSAITDWFTLTDANGQTITVPPGRLFIMLYPDTSEISWYNTGMAETTGSIDEPAVTPDDPVAHTDAALDRIDADPTNSFTAVHHDRARRDAAAAERASPLGGMAVAIKDLIDEAGQVTTAGSAFYRHRPQTSATVVQRLQAAGGVIVGRTGLHEFAYGFSSENPWFGPVRNPWDLSLSPGGSSGGSAAAVAAGLVPVALGTDTGGSVRVPAALCGIMGLKVTHGAVPLTGVFPLAASLDTVGVLARSIADLSVVHAVISGYDAHDVWSRHLPDSGDSVPIASLRIGVPTAWMASVPTSNAVAATFAGFTARVAQLGAEIVELDLDRLAPTPHLGTLSAAEAASVHRAWFTDVDKPYGADVEERLAQAMEVTTDQLVAARAWQAALRQSVDAAFAQCDVLATPTVGHAHKTIGDDTIRLDDADVFYRPVLSGYTALVNIVGCPALALPLDLDGPIPQSIQLVGPRHREHRLVDIGRQLETAGLVATRRPPHWIG